MQHLFLGSWVQKCSEFFLYSCGQKWQQLSLYSYDQKCSEWSYTVGTEV